MANHNETLSVLLEKFTARLDRLQASVDRSLAKMEKTRAARDGIRLALEIEGGWSPSANIDAENNGQSNQSPPHSTTGLTPAIKEMLPVFPTDITSPNVISALRAKNPSLVEEGKESSVSSALKRLERQGLLKQVEKGSGRRPTRFEYVGNDDAQELLSVASESNRGGEHDI